MQYVHGMLHHVELVWLFAGCQIGCGYSNANDQQIRQCRLSNLPDLNQDNPYVAQQLLDWHKDA